MTKSYEKYINELYNNSINDSIDKPRYIEFKSKIRRSYTNEEFPTGRIPWYLRIFWKCFK